MEWSFEPFLYPQIGECLFWPCSEGDPKNLKHHLRTNFRFRSSNVITYFWDPSEDHGTP